MGRTRFDCVLSAVEASRSPSLRGEAWCCVFEAELLSSQVNVL